MVLIRLIVMEALLHNVHISAEWVSTGDNGKTDALSRMDFDRFHRLGPLMDSLPTQIHEDLWPIQKLWIK